MPRADENVGRPMALGGVAPFAPPWSWWEGNDRRDGIAARGFDCSMDNGRSLRGRGSTGFAR